MKNLLFALAVMVSLPALSQNSCEPRTTEWLPVLRHSSGSVFIRITYHKCTQDGICGWPLIQLRHSFPFQARLNVKLSGINCQDELLESSFSTGGNKIAAHTDHKSNGNWHLYKRVDKPILVEVDYDQGNDHYTIKQVDGVIKLYKNNQLVNANGLTEKEEQKQKEEAEKRKREEEKAEEQKKKAADKLKAENDRLEITIQADINRIDAEQPRSKMQQEFDDLRNKEMTEEERESSLRSFHADVKSVARRVQQNKETFASNKEARDEQIDDIRDRNEEIRKEQAQIVGGLALIGAGIFSSEGRKGRGNRFSGTSYKFSIKGGLHGVIQPLGTLQHTSGSVYNYSNGNLYPLNEEDFEEEVLMAPGLYLTMEFHPLFSNYGSLGFTGSLSYAFWPAANDGSSDASSNYAGNSSSTMFNYNYGVELTLGSRPVKLLARYHWHAQDIMSSSIHSFSYDDGYSAMESETYYVASQKWQQQWAALGLRLGDYTKQRWFLDLAYTRYIPTSMNGNKTIFKPKDLMTTPADFKIPHGGYIQYSQQNGWFVRLVHTKDNLITDEENLVLYKGEKGFTSITIGKSLEWFGRRW